MDVMTQLVNQLLTLVDTAPWWQLLLIVGVLLVLETSVGIGLITPGEVVLLTAATAVTGPGEYAMLACVAAVASLVGQSGGYLIGRRAGDRVRRSRVGRWIGEPQWQRAERMVAGGRGRALAGSRFLSVAHSLVPVIAGTLRMEPVRFFRFTTIGVVLWSLIFVGLGSAASAAVRSSAHLVGPTITAMVITAVVVAIVVRQVGSWRARRLLRQTMATSQARGAVRPSHRVAPGRTGPPRRR